MKIYVVSLLILFAFITNTSKAQSGFCHANLKLSGPGTLVSFTNPLTNSQIDLFSGLINGTIDNRQTQFYCNEFFRSIQIPGGGYTDSATVTRPEMVYILNNYYPFVPNPPGKLTNLNNEAAATQLALWHFSSNVNANSIISADIRQRTLEIILDAVANSGQIYVRYTLDILPDIDPEYFVVKTTDSEGIGISVDSIELMLTQSGGSLSTNMVSTINGYSEPVQVIDASTGLLTAKGNCIMPPGILFASASHNRRSLILAKPAFGKKSISYDWGTLPVELSSFTYTVKSNNVFLNWLTASETNNKGFYIERCSVENDQHWINAGFVKGNGTIDEPVSYSFTDKFISPGKYKYRLKQVDYNGNFEFHYLNGEVSVSPPERFSLKQNYPNPFNPVTKISFEIPSVSSVDLRIYDVLGKEVHVIFKGELNAGSYEFDFNGSGFSSGLYYYRAKVNGLVQTKQMVLSK